MSKFCARKDEQPAQDGDFKVKVRVEVKAKITISLLYLYLMPLFVDQKSRTITVGCSSCRNII
jgi:hypothetical protein